MRATEGQDPLHSAVLDAKLLLEKSNLAVPAVEPDLETNVTILALGRHCQDFGDGVVAQCHDLEDG
jgi:hypothetical protein